MGLAPVFCCPRTEACLRGTEPELTCIQPLRISGESGGTDWILPPVRGKRGPSRRSDKRKNFECHLGGHPTFELLWRGKMKGPDGEQGVGLRV